MFLAKANVFKLKPGLKLQYNNKKDYYDGTVCHISKVQIHVYMNIQRKTKIVGKVEITFPPNEYGSRKRIYKLEDCTHFEMVD